MVRTRFLGFIALAMPLALLGCGPRDKDGRNLDSLDNELIEAGNANSHDPAMMSALQDQIMVDPSLAHKANDDAIRPPTQPLSGAVPPENIAAASAGAAASTGQASSRVVKSTPAPTGTGCPQCDAARASLTLGALASRQSDRRTASCAGTLRYSAGWANRLPVDLPLYPDARVSEAAGSDGGACALRAVSFSTSASLQQVMDWYYTRATDAGFSAEQQSDGSEHVLGGTRERDGGAFALFLTSRGDGGTDVDLIANNGR
ncbi:MAG: hypothetical protein WC804_08515 [Sphingomonas sp.]|jgi:hypothetical protein|uniref:hypothetical protein n=1 Tax=Sphingomonas sp. TaxID=28214 RepID=UPI003561E138